MEYNGARKESRTAK